MSDDFPAGQDTQSSLDELPTTVDDVPAGHCSQLDCLDASAKVPAAQSTQSVLVELPVMSDDVPAGQDTQSAPEKLPTASDDVPAGQGLQLDWPGASVKVPAEQE
jgi:hypothetical protein